MTAKVVTLASAGTAPDARAELRRMIAEQAGREAEAQTLNESLTRTWGALSRARDAVSAANAALGKAKLDQVKSVAADLRAGGSGGADALMIRRAREALAEAEDHLAATQVARSELEAEIAELAKDGHKHPITSATADILIPVAEALFERLIQSRMTYRAQKAALEHLEKENLLAPQLRSKVVALITADSILLPPSYGSSHPMQAPPPERGIGDFIAALRELRANPDVAIPVI